MMRSEGTTLIVDCRISPDDWAAAAIESGARSTRDARWLLPIFIFVNSCGAAVVALAVSGHLDGGSAMIAALIPLLFTLLTSGRMLKRGNPREAYRQYYARQFSGTSGSYRITVDEHGVVSFTEFGVASLNWRGIARFDLAPGHVMIIRRVGGPLPISRDAFAGEEEMRRFVEVGNRLRDEAASNKSADAAARQT